MSMNKRNVPISSLLDSTSDDNKGEEEKKESNSLPSILPTAPISIQSLVSRFQTSIDVSLRPQADNNNSNTSSYPQENTENSISGSNENYASSQVWNSNSIDSNLTASQTYQPDQSKISNLVALKPKSALEKSHIDNEVANTKSSFVASDYIKDFQTSFLPNIPFKATHESKTSINSIMNTDSGPSIPAISAIATPKPKRKYTRKKKADTELNGPAVKKGKVLSEISEEKFKLNTLEDNNVKINTTVDPSNKAVEGIVKPENEKKKRQTKPKTAGADSKKPSKSKRKTPELPVSNGNPKDAVKEVTEKIAVHAAMTADRSKTVESNIELPPAVILDVNTSKLDTSANSPFSNIASMTNSSKEKKREIEIGKGKDKDNDDDKKERDNDKDKVDEVDKETEKQKDKEKEKGKVKEKEKEKAKEKDKPELPIIALNIPLIDPKDPKPGQGEVVINVLKLAEDKYGWSVIHPHAKSAIDIMDEMIEDDEDGAEEEDDEELIIEDVKQAKKKKDEEELTEEQLVRRHEVKMNRKVGKYDYEDPFIDDQELQMEEEITSTKEGFFVYWGPLVDDRSASNGSNKKNMTKAKK